MACFVYILKCADGSFYTGTVRDHSMDRRVSEHNNGHYVDSFTMSRRPVELVFAEEFLSIAEAIAAERRIKGWSRVKKQAMIDSRWIDLPNLAKRPTSKFRVNE